MGRKKGLGRFLSDFIFFFLSSLSLHTEFFGDPTVLPHTASYSLTTTKNAFQLLNQIVGQLITYQSHQQCFLLFHLSTLQFVHIKEDIFAGDFDKEGLMLFVALSTFRFYVFEFKHCQQDILKGYSCLKNSIKASIKNSKPHVFVWLIVCI